MKKLLLTAALIGTVATAYSQGTVNIANSQRLISFKPLVGDTIVLPGSATAGTYTFALLVAPSTVTGFVPLAGNSVADWNATETSLAGFTATVYGTQHATAAGRVVFTPSPSTLAGFAEGATVNMVLVGWKGTGTWADILAAGPAPVEVGTSTLATLKLGGGPNPIPALFSGEAGALNNGFTINAIIVPEPTSFALLGLGAAGLLIFRRRN